MKYILIAALVCAVASLASAADGDLSDLRGLQCPEAGYMYPDADNLCFVWFCERAHQSAIKRPCPKGVRVPSWWTGGKLNMCFIVNILKHGGEPTCLRCAANDELVQETCDSNPCDDGCTCIDTEHTYQCSCPYEAGAIGGGGGGVEVNHCEPDMCENNARCENQYDGFFCHCPNGYTGHRCETSVCDWHPCLNGGSCIIDEVGYHCECQDCWTGSCCNATIPGSICEECPDCLTGDQCNIPIDSCACRGDEYCGGDGNCTDTSGGPQCDCPKCYGGPSCKILLDSCECNNNCPENSVCDDVFASDGQAISHSCTCKDCYSGPTCSAIVNCDCHNPCGDNEYCTMVNDEPQCGCTDDCLTGPNCSEVPNTCACSNRCLNGDCYDTSTGPKCRNCDDCYTGDYCDSSVINCDCNNPCDEYHLCEMQQGSPVCVCPSCLTGAICEQTLQTCDCADPCVTGECQDSDTGPICEGCADCYQGPYCDQQIISCTCDSPCTTDQQCTMIDDQPTCGCDDSCYTGSSCTTLINSCACNNPCVHGTCSDSSNGPVCSCDDCYSGDYCDQEIVSCECHSPCNEYQECSMVGGSPVCGCTECMEGPRCDETINSCACSNPCVGGQQCVDSISGATCECDCIGNEVCVEKSDGGFCECPKCYVHENGQERGCGKAITHLCECNDPCDGDQEVCFDGVTETDEPDCVIGNPSSGNAFTVVFEENETEKAIREIPLELYLTPSARGTGSRRVSITSAGLHPDHHCYFDDEVIIPQDDVVRYTVERCMMHNNTGIQNLAIKLVELDRKAMIVYGINKDRWTADAFLAVPDTQAGWKYQTSSYAPAHISTQFAIVALRDNTSVTIELADDNDLPAPYNRAGSTYQVTLNAFQTFQVQARCSDNNFGKKSSCSKDLSGSVITTDEKHPIHVFSGNVRAFINAGEGTSRDHLVEQLVSVDKWGMNFGFVSVPSRVVGDVLNVMAIKGETALVEIYRIDKNGEETVQRFTLPENGRLNKYIQVPSGLRYFVHSDKRLSVMQLTKSKDTYLYNNESFHDPVAMTVPPVEQFTNYFFISTPLFTGGENFMLKPYNTTMALLVAYKGSEQYIKLNNRALVESDFLLPWGDLPMGSHGANGHALVGATIRISHGTHLIWSQGAPAGKDKFQTLVYGFDDRESYGFPAAMNMNTIVPEES